MGDRFYLQQKAANGKGGKNGPEKPPRRLKKDIIKEIHNIAPNLTGLTKLTIADLDKLNEYINEQ